MWPQQRQKQRFTHSEAVMEALHLQRIMESIGEAKQTTIRCDSQSCLALVSKHYGSYKVKHFTTRLAFLKDTVKCSEHRIYLKFVSSADNKADLFKKNWTHSRRGCHETGRKKQVEKILVEKGRKVLRSKIENTRTRIEWIRSNLFFSWSNRVCSQICLPATQIVLDFRAEMNPVVANENDNDVENATAYRVM